MFSEPNCSKRRCIHFQGVKQFGNEGEIDQLLVCKAFPKGIPEDISYGDNKHTKPIKNQKNKIVYEKAK